MQRWFSSLRSVGLRGCVLLSLASCTPNAGPAALDPPVVEPVRTVMTTVRATPSGLPPASSASAVAEAKPLAVACSSNADCDWDDPCFPRACGGRSAGAGRACDESMQPDGTCACVEGVCSKKPNSPVAASGTCEARGCIVDPGRARCIADTAGVADGLRTNGHVNEGPSCDCIAPASGCQFNWFDAVPCKTELDCWVTFDPRPRPIPRPKNLRRPFEPCRDGETAPVCEAGKCRVGPHYKC